MHSSTTERDPQAPSKQAMKQVADNWEPQNTTSPGEYTAYHEASDTFLELSRASLDGMQTDPSVRQLIDSTAAEGGFKVTARFFYTGAHLARVNSFSQEELKKALYTAGSFRTLQTLTREWNGSAVPIEYSVGLNGTLYGNGLIEREFTLNLEDGLQIPYYAMHSYRARSGLVEAGYLTEKEAYAHPAAEDTVRCLGHRAGLLTHVYKHLLTIADTDPSLFEATLA